MAKIYKATIFLIYLAIFGINFAESDPVNCKDIQCPPPEIIENCPADSVLTDKFDLITTLLTTIATTTPTTTTTTTTTTVKRTTPEIISSAKSSVNDNLYDDESSNEADSIEMTDYSITSQYPTKLNQHVTDDTVNNSISTDNFIKEPVSFLQSSVSSIDIESFSSPSINSTNSITTTNTNNDKTKKPRNHRKKTTKGTKNLKSTTEQTIEPITTTKETQQNESSQSHNHVLEKRSLRSYQRESIKIVPGGYISYEPQVLHYRQYNNHHKWKRNASPEPIEQHKIVGTNYVSTQLPTIYQKQICCPKRKCTCRENGCNKPICVKSENILVEIKPGSNIPGQCCPQYECIDSEPECLDNNSTGKPYWISKCEKCKCFRGTKLCYDGCPEPIKPRNCYSNALQKSFPHGWTWKEDDCATCECVDGRMDCMISYCKPKNCKKEIKIPGQCCRVCEENILTTTSITIPTTLPTQITTLITADYLPESNTMNLTTTTAPLTTWQSSKSDSIFRDISENYIFVILLCFVAVVIIAAIIMFIYTKCKQRVYEPVKKSESTNSSQTQEKPTVLIKASNSQ